VLSLLIRPGETATKGLVFIPGWVKRVYTDMKGDICVSSRPERPAGEGRQWLTSRFTYIVWEIASDTQLHWIELVPGLHGRSKLGGTEKNYLTLSGTELTHTYTVHRNFHQHVSSNSVVSYKL
jgi:hypothetical protein